MRAVYLLLCVLGTVVPCAILGGWLAEHGPDAGLLMRQAASSPVAAFAWADVLLSGVALLCFIAHRQRTAPVRHVWLPVLGLLCVGVSLALPLYLYLCELRDAPRRGR